MDSSYRAGMDIRTCVAMGPSKRGSSTPRSPGHRFLRETLGIGRWILSCRVWASLLDSEMFGDSLTCATKMEEVGKVVGFSESSYGSQW